MELLAGVLTALVGVMQQLLGSTPPPQRHQQCIDHQLGRHLLVHTSACNTLGIWDWSALTELEVSVEEARAILGEIDGEAREISPEHFRESLQVELEHETRFRDANSTNNHPVLTGKIVLAHPEESLLYYKRVAIAELEGDLLKATKECDADKLRSLYERIVLARRALNQEEVSFLAGTRRQAG